MSALTELVARWRERVEAMRFAAEPTLAAEVSECADELESALAAERAREPACSNDYRIGFQAGKAAADRGAGRECEMWRSIAEDLIGCTVYRDGTGMMPQSTSHMRASEFAAYVQRQMRDVLASLSTPTPEASRECSQCGSTVHVTDDICFACYHADGPTPTPEAQP